MNIIEDIKRKHPPVNKNDKDCFTMLEMMERTGETESTIYRMVQRALASGEWEFAGYKRSFGGRSAKAYRYVKSKK